MGSGEKPSYHPIANLKNFQLIEKPFVQRFLKSLYYTFLLSSAHRIPGIFSIFSVLIIQWFLSDGIVCLAVKLIGCDLCQPGAQQTTAYLASSAFPAFPPMPNDIPLFGRKISNLIGPNAGIARDKASWKKQVR